MTYEKHIAELQSELDHAVVVTGAMQAALKAAIALMQAAEPKDAAEQTVCDAYACCMEGDPLVNSSHVAEARAHARAEGYAAGRKDGEAAREEVAKWRASDHKHLNALTAALTELHELNNNWKRDVDTLEAKLAAAQAELRAAREVLVHIVPLDTGIAEARSHFNLRECKERLGIVSCRMDGTRVDELRASGMVRSVTVDGEVSALAAAQARIVDLEDQLAGPHWAGTGRPTYGELRTQLAAAQAEIETLRRGGLALGQHIDALETKLTNLRAAADRAYDAWCWKEPLELTKAMGDIYQCLQGTNEIDRARVVTKTQTPSGVRAENRSLRERLDEITQALGLDCGDSSCMYAPLSGGMRTNGGCTCDPVRSVARLKSRPPRETFDPEAVRALLNEITDAAREGRLNCPSVHILSKRVRDSERK